MKTRAGRIRALSAKAPDNSAAGSVEVTPW